MSFLTKIFNWIKGILDGIPNEIREKAEIALRVTRAIKDNVNNPLVDLITDIIPGDIDDNVKDKIRTCLDKMEDWLEALSGLSPKELNAILIKIASEITACLDDNELPENRYDTITQVVYSSKK
jgi:hypothetical protein